MHRLGMYKVVASPLREGVQPPFQRPAQSNNMMHIWRLPLSSWSIRVASGCISSRAIFRLVQVQQQCKTSRHTRKVVPNFQHHVQSQATWQRMATHSYQVSEIRKAGSRAAASYHVVSLLQIVGCDGHHHNGRFMASRDLHRTVQKTRHESQQRPLYMYPLRHQVSSATRVMELRMAATSVAQFPGLVLGLVGP